MSSITQAIAKAQSRFSAVYQTKRGTYRMDDLEDPFNSPLEAGLSKEYAQAMRAMEIVVKVCEDLDPMIEEDNDVGDLFYLDFVPHMRMRLDDELWKTDDHTIRSIVEEWLEKRPDVITSV